MKAIKNGKIIMPQGILENQVLVFDEVIRSIQVEIFGTYPQHVFYVGFGLFRGYVGTALLLHIKSFNHEILRLEKIFFAVIFISADLFRV